MSGPDHVTHDGMMLSPLTARRKERWKNEIRTWWDFELRCKLDRLAILEYATRGRVGRETLEMDDEHRRKRFDEHRSNSFSRARQSDLCDLGL